MKPAERTFLLSPTLIWSVIFIVLPFFIVLAFSFATKGLHGEVIWDLSLDNYKKVFSLMYVKVAWISLQMALLNTALCLMVSYPLAFYIARIESDKKRNLLMLLVLIPFWTNFLVRTYALGNILGDEGLINQCLLYLRIIDEPLDLIYSKKAIVLGLISNYLPFMVLPLYVSLQKQDKHLLEAASDLGATPFRAFARVTWPLSLPGVATGCLMVFIPSLGEFIIPDLLGGGKYLLLGNLLQQKFLITRDWPLGSALSVVLALILLLLLFISRGLRREDEENL